MIEIVCESLQEGYQEACRQLDCSVGELHIEIVQYPRSLFGLVKKPAILKAYKRQSKWLSPFDLESKNRPSPLTIASAISPKSTAGDPKKPQISAPEHPQIPKTYIKDHDILGAFYEGFSSNQAPMYDPKAYDAQQSSNQIKQQHLKDIKYHIKNTFCLPCLDCTLVELSWHDDKTLYIKFDGQDAPLLIGKNGYRYKALSYLLFSWIFERYGYFIKLEVGEFLKNQSIMIQKHLRPLIDRIEREGRGSSDVLDGVLLHLGVELLRETFPEKMVAIKPKRDGGRYIKVDDFRR